VCDTAILYGRGHALRLARGPNFLHGESMKEARFHSWQPVLLRPFRKSAIARRSLRWKPASAERPSIYRKKDATAPNAVKHRPLPRQIAAASRSVAARHLASSVSSATAGGLPGLAMGEGAAVQGTLCGYVAVGVHLQS
jgi:hypothetical protein